MLVPLLSLWTFFCSMVLLWFVGVGSGLDALVLTVLSVCCLALAFRLRV